MKHHLAILFILTTLTASSQVDLSGTVYHDSSPVAFATVFAPALGRGAVCDENGNFVISQIQEGELYLVVRALGYAETTISIKAVSGMLPLRIGMKESIIFTEAAVVSGTGAERSTSELAVKVDLLSAASLAENRSLCLADGLCAAPGLRVEKNCQTCGYSQVGMNGLPGRYTQILINGRPLFGALVGLYGLEQIPSGLIEQIEVVRGGGSVLFGANAIAGTVNIITRKEIDPNASVHLTGGSFLRLGIGGNGVAEASVSFRGKGSAGGSVFLSHSQSKALDVNSDGFSELPARSGTTAGVFGFVPINQNAYMRITTFALDENRNGGDRLDLLPHERLQTEWRKTRMVAGHADFVFPFAQQKGQVSFYLGAQKADRAHYTGIFGSDGYGNTDVRTLVAGVQAHRIFSVGKRRMDLTAGSDYFFEHARDQVPVYGYHIDQRLFSLAAFGQGDWKLTERVSLLGGVRVTHHSLVDNPIVTPRLALMHRAASAISRLALAYGFSPPSAFDADLHMAFANGEVTMVLPDRDLAPERSRSITLSHERTIVLQKFSFSPGASLFATRLLHPFVLQNTGGTGQTVFLRTNGSGATVAGLTAELKWKFKTRTTGDASFTLQQSRLDEAIIWSENQPGVVAYLRSPDAYGYATVKHQITERWTIGSTLTLTGPMLVPHLAGAPGVDDDVLVRSPWFADQMLKADFNATNGRSGDWNMYFGVSNVFNAFQKDFDIGPSRDSNFIYGPASPRMFFGGLRWQLK